jgi:hypothetical protein
MSTRRVAEEMQDALEALDRLETARVRTIGELQSERAAKEAAVPRIVQATRVVVQGVRDEIADFDEQLTQLGALPAPAVPVDTPVETPATPGTPRHAAPTPDPPTPAAGTRAVAHHHVFDVRHWSEVQWVLAVLGLIVGLIVAACTWHPLFEGIHGPGRGVAVTFWWIALPLFGFFSFGWMGSYVDRALNRRQARRNAGIAVPANYEQP